MVRSRKKITVAISLVLLAKDFVTHSLQIARICASFVPCPWPKFRRELATFFYFRLLNRTVVKWAWMGLLNRERRA